MSQSITHDGISIMSGEHSKFSTCFLIFVKQKPSLWHSLLIHCVPKIKTTPVETTRRVEFIKLAINLNKQEQQMGGISILIKSRFRK